METNKKSPEYFLGIDGGGTKTMFALADGDGEIIRKIKLGSANPFDIGIEKCLEVLDEGIEEITSGLSKQSISMFAGLAGGSSGNAKEKIAEGLKKYGFRSCSNGSDAENIIAAGLGEDDGIALIMGTGSVAFVQRGREIIRVGGLGYLFDHGGSAYDLGNEAIRAACYAEYDPSQRTVLHEMFLEQFHTPTVAENLSYFYEIGKKGIASYAPMVFAAYRKGDETATRIIENNAAAIARLIDICRQYFSKDSSVKIIMVGGLTAEKDILLPMIQKYADFDKCAYEMSVYDGDVVKGALLRAGMKNKEN